MGQSENTEAGDIVVLYWGFGSEAHLCHFVPRIPGFSSGHRHCYVPSLKSNRAGHGLRVRPVCLDQASNPVCQVPAVATCGGCRGVGACSEITGVPAPLHVLVTVAVMARLATCGTPVCCERAAPPAPSAFGTVPWRASAVTLPWKPWGPFQSQRSSQLGRPGRSPAPCCSHPLSPAEPGVGPGQRVSDDHSASSFWKRLHPSVLRLLTWSMQPGPCGLNRALLGGGRRWSPEHAVREAAVLWLLCPRRAAEVSGAPGMSLRYTQCHHLHAQRSPLTSLLAGCSEIGFVQVHSVPQHPPGGMRACAIARRRSPGGCGLRRGCSANTPVQVGQKPSALRRGDSGTWWRCLSDFTDCPCFPGFTSRRWPGGI